MTALSPIRFPSPFPLPGRFPRLIVERKKSLTPEQAQLELEYNSNNKLFKKVDELISATVPSHGEEIPDLDMFLRQSGLSKEAMLALFNGSQGPNDSLSEDGKLLMRCGFEVFCCLKEHLIKDTAGSMDISDLYEYAKTEPPGGRKMDNLLKNLLKNGENDKLLKPFIERAKKAIGITSFVRL